MPLHRPKYLVEYDPTADPIEVVVSSGDMMRAELEQGALKLPDRAPFHTTALWLWSALVRAGLEDRKARDFIADPPEWQPVKGDGPNGEAGIVDPTTAEPGATGSAVPGSTAPQSSG